MSTHDRRRIAPPWGWRRPGGGRVAHVPRVPQWQSTTTQVAGLFPFVAGSGSPSVGVPIGRHMMWGEVVCMDPFAWSAAGLVTNPGIFVLGAPGVGKSAIAKRLMRGMAAYGVRPLVLGDTKPDYVPLVDRLGGQVIRVGRGMDTINPLDSGPLGVAGDRLTGDAGVQLAAEIRGRRVAAVMALCSLVRRDVPIRNVEENVLACAIDLLVDRATGPGDPTIPDVLGVVRDGPDRLMAATECDTRDEYRAEVRELLHTLNLLCTGSLAGVFDGPTSRPIDLDAPAAVVDISRAAAAGDLLVSAAMLSTWSYGFGFVDAAHALSRAGIIAPRLYFAVLDELWRALRGAPGLVEQADALTRLNRARGMGHVMITHSLSDLEALPTHEERQKAKGFAERCGTKILAGMPPRELDQVHKVVPLSASERRLVASWSAPESWLVGSKHPGRGKYLVKTGPRIGIPVEMEYVTDEAVLYDTDARMRQAVAL